MEKFAPLHKSLYYNTKVQKISFPEIPPDRYRGYGRFFTFPCPLVLPDQKWEHPEAGRESILCGGLEGKRAWDFGCARKMGKLPMKNNKIIITIYLCYRHQSNYTTAKRPVKQDFSVYFRRCTTQNIVSCRKFMELQLIPLVAPPSLTLWLDTIPGPKWIPHPSPYTPNRPPFFTKLGGGRNKRDDSVKEALKILGRDAQSFFFVPSPYSSSSFFLSHRQMSINRPRRILPCLLSVSPSPRALGLQTGG